MEKFLKPRLLTPREQDRKKFWQAVGLCALTAAIFFLPFYILDGGFFHYAGDFNSQPMATPSTLSHKRCPNLRTVSRKSFAVSLHTK